MRTLQKTFTTQSTQQTRKLQNSSNISKLEHEHREHGFQVFISGANKERSKLQDLQRKTLQSKKKIVNNNNTLQRKNRPPNKEFAKRKIWQKSSNIEIKQSDGSKFVFSNPRPSKLGNGLSGSILHDITSKNIELHSSVKNHSQLNDIRNRYKAYFHIDGHGFCYSKNLSKPSTPTRYQIDKTSSIFNRKSFKYLKRIQARPISSSCFPQPCNIEEQQSEYYSLLNKNKKCMSDLQELLTPNYEYCQNAKEGNIQNSHEDITKDVKLLDSYDGIDYDVFYHEEQIICRSARALLLDKILNESVFKGGDENGKELRSGYSNETSTNKLKPHYDYNYEPCLRPTTSFCKLKEIENEINQYDERALVLLNNCKVTNESILENKENDCFLPLGKALSPIFRLVKSSTDHVIEEKEQCLVNEKQCIFNKKDSTLCNNVFDIELPSRHLDNEYKNALKLNLRYICQDLNSKVCDMKKLNILQSNSCDEDSTSSNTDESSRTIDHSTTCCSTLNNSEISPEWIDHHEHENLKLLLEKTSRELEDADIVVDKNNNSSICYNKHFKIEEFSKKISPSLRINLLSARVQKLDIKKQIYLSHILDRLEIAHVSRSVDFFCHIGLQGIGREDRLSI